MQQLSGIAPVTKARGKTKIVQMRWVCPKFVRQTFHEFARCSIKYSRWAKAYVEMRKAKGHRYHQCWKTHELYDEQSPPPTASGHRLETRPIPNLQSGFNHLTNQLRCLGCGL
jgi:hypothetical protein